MNNYRDRISSDASNDMRWDLYEFTRDSKLPYGTFGRRINPDIVVLVGCLIALVVGIVAAWIEYLTR